MLAAATLHSGERFLVAVDKARAHNADELALAAHHHASDCLAVYRAVDRLAHGAVGEGVAVTNVGGAQRIVRDVEYEEDDAVLLASVDTDAGRLSQAGNVLHWQVINDVDLA